MLGEGDFPTSENSAYQPMPATKKYNFQNYPMSDTSTKTANSKKKKRKLVMCQTNI